MEQFWRILGQVFGTCLACFPGIVHSSLDSFREYCCRLKTYKKLIKTTYINLLNPIKTQLFKRLYILGTRPRPHPEAMISEQSVLWQLIQSLPPLISQVTQTYGRRKALFLPLLSARGVPPQESCLIKKDSFLLNEYSFAFKESGR